MSLKIQQILPHREDHSLNVSNSLRCIPLGRFTVRIRLLQDNARDFKRGFQVFKNVILASIHS